MSSGTDGENEFLSILNGGMLEFSTDFEDTRVRLNAYMGLSADHSDMGTNISIIPYKHDWRIGSQHQSISDASIPIQETLKKVDDKAD